MGIIRLEARTHITRSYPLPENAGKDAARLSREIFPETGAKRYYARAFLLDSSLADRGS